MRRATERAAGVGSGDEARRERRRSRRSSSCRSCSIPVLFAVFIFGRLAHTRIVLDAAAAAGARQAAVVGADTPTVRGRIATELRDGGPRSGPRQGDRRAIGGRLGRADPGPARDRRGGRHSVPGHLDHSAVVGVRHPERGDPLMTRSRTRAGERGQVAVYAILLFPLLMLVLALVLAVGIDRGAADPDPRPARHGRTHRHAGARHRRARARWRARAGRRDGRRACPRVPRAGTSPRSGIRSSRRRRRLPVRPRSW